MSDLLDTLRIVLFCDLSLFGDIGGTNKTIYIDGQCSFSPSNAHGLRWQFIADDNKYCRWLMS